MSTFHDRVKLARTTLAAMRERVGARGQVVPVAGDANPTDASTPAEDSRG